MENASESSQWFEMSMPQSLTPAANGSTEIEQTFEEIFAQLDPDRADWMLSLLEECEQTPDCEGSEMWEHFLSELQQQHSVSQASSLRGTSVTPSPSLEDFEAGPESAPIPFGASLFTPTESHFSVPTRKTFSQSDKTLAQMMESSAVESDPATRSNHKQRSKDQDVARSDRNLRSYSRVLRSANAKKRAQYLEKWGGV